MIIKGLGLAKYEGLINSNELYMDYELSHGDHDLFTVTWSKEDQVWYSTYRSADTPDGDYGEPVDLEEMDTAMLRSRIPFGHMPIDYLNNFAELWKKEHHVV
jgi:hypothetical protein